APILVRVPGLNTPSKLARIHAPTVNDVFVSLRKSSPIVVIDEKSGKRQLIWAEVDMNDSHPSSRLLEIHPGRNLREAHTYIVALRNVGRKGRRVPARLLRKLARAGIKRRGQL